MDGANSNTHCDIRATYATIMSEKVVIMANCSGKCAATSQNMKRVKWSAIHQGNRFVQEPGRNVQRRWACHACPSYFTTRDEFLDHFIPLHDPNDMYRSAYDDIDFTCGYRNARLKLKRGKHGSNTETRQIEKSIRESSLTRADTGESYLARFSMHKASSDALKAFYNSPGKRSQDRHLEIQSKARFAPVRDFTHSS
ncbi:hypothetical protein MBANPS3_011119 [Mucor bainieri]